MFLKLWKVKHLIKFIFLFCILSQSNIYGVDNSKFLIKEFTKIEEKDNSEKINLQSFYLLGPGDSLLIFFNGLDIYSGEYPINSDGYLSLPEIGLFYAENLTLQELQKSLEERYLEFIKNPDLLINIASYRPLTIYVSGEVQSPGIYTLKGNNATIPTTNKEGIIVTKQKNFRNFNIKLFDGLKVAKGVKNSADISKIQIIRKNSNFQGGGKIKTNINLLSTLKEGDLNQNIRLFDEDFIIVPKSEIPIKDQIIAINNFNLNPNKIKIYVTGNVPTPGEFTLDKGTSLIQAITSTGGKKLMSGDVEFLRFNNDGSTKKSKFRFNQNALINTDKNPILMEGDVINIRKTILGKTTEVLREFSNPILSGYGLYNIFN